MEKQELDLFDIMELVTILKEYFRVHNITSMTQGGLSIRYTEPPKKRKG